MGKRKMKFKGNSNPKKSKISSATGSVDNITVSSQNSPSKKPKPRSKTDDWKPSEKVHKLQLHQANAEEDKVIKKLEKALKLNRRKKKKKGGNNKNCNETQEIKKNTVNRMFLDDGLDYILNVLDRKGDHIDSDLSNDDEIDEDLPIATGEQMSSGKKKKKSGQLESSVPPKRPRRLADLLVELREEPSEASLPLNKRDTVSSDDDEDLHLSGNDDDDDDGNSDDQSVGAVLPEGNQQSEDRKPEFWEDIYGRQRDRIGNVVYSKSDKSGVYIPPAKRSESLSVDEKKKAELVKIKRQLKGLINRLSESNMQPICSQVEQMYMKNSRNDMNETLFALMTELLISPAMTPPRLVMEQAMLVALLHANVGSEVGAYFLQRLATEFNELLLSGGSYGQGKLSDNLLVFICHLYNYKVTHCTLIFDILKCLIDSFQEKDIELIQLLLKTVGFTLRKDDPLKLKEVVHLIQTKAPVFEFTENSSRVQFMLDTLLAIRNNNMYKIPQYDPTIMQHMKKVLRGLLRSGSSVQELAISYEDILKAEERGRWWIVGSAWSERCATEISDKGSSTGSTLTFHKTEVSDKILELARKQHMNTEVRKTIFCIIMTAEDYMDSFEKLLRLNLKNQQEREIISVILHCVLHEKNYNPYYAYLAGKFCRFARKYYMNLQFSLWDKFKDLDKFESCQITCLASFLVHLFVKGDMPISVLKVIHFSEMSKSMVRFFRKILLGVLMQDSEEDCVNVFERIVPAKNLNVLRESLRLFMHHFLLRNVSKLGPEMKKLPERVKLAENALNSAKHAFKL